MNGSGEDILANLPFRDPDLPLEVRVNDLVFRLNLEEKIGLIPTRQEAVERLGIDKYTFGGEAAHGFVDRKEKRAATVFPQPIGLGCSWDTELLQKIGRAIGREARGFYRLREGRSGLSLWAPTVDLERDPRWGRTQEAYGEDPYLTGSLSTFLVKGMQGNDSFYLRMAAALKHFYANNNEEDRCSCSVSISPRNMREYYWQAFKIPVVEGGVCGLMTAYNSVNGTPCNLNSDIRWVVKGEWGLSGYVVSDGHDFQQTVTCHKYYGNYAEVAADTIKSGVDTIPDDPELVKEAVSKAVESGLLVEEELERAIKNTLRIRFRLGQFDPEDRNPYTEIDGSVICCEEHRELALEAVRKSIVLLKNDDFFPLRDDEFDKLAVIGPLADKVFRDWYTGFPAQTKTPLEGLRERFAGKKVSGISAADEVRLQCGDGRYIFVDKSKGNRLRAGKNPEMALSVFKLTDWGWGHYTLYSPEVDRYVTLTEDNHLSASSKEVWSWYVRECFHIEFCEESQIQISDCFHSRIGLSGDLLKGEQDDYTPLHLIKLQDGKEEAVAAAREADRVLVFLGNQPMINGKEEFDRPDITLPSSQQELLEEVFAVNQNTGLVLVSSYPLAVKWANQKIPGIFFSSHGGQEFGTALTEVLAGDYNPGGRLNMTWYKSKAQLPEIKDYDVIQGGRTYMYFEGEALYPFGHGLSYTDFNYLGVETGAREFKPGDEIDLKVKIENRGTVPGDEVIQLYVQPPESRVKKPGKQLVGFRRVRFKPGEVKEISLSLEVDDLCFWDVIQEKWLVEDGSYRLMIGSSSQDIRLTADIRVIGEHIPLRNPFSSTGAVNYDAGEQIELIEDGKGGTAVRINEKGWVEYRDFSLSEKSQELFLQVRGDKSVKISVILKPVTGEFRETYDIEINQEKVKPESSAGGWRDVSITLENKKRRGIYTVIISARKRIDLNEIRFE